MATCQICGRTIKDKAGKIAHHGYKRPGNGWQTASCMGARHLPYEQSCDLIPVAIDSVKAYIVKSQAMLADLIANPPATLTYKRGSYGETRTVERPDVLNPYREGNMHTYESLLKQRKSDIERSIKFAQSDIEYLIERLANWRKAE